MQSHSREATPILFVKATVMPRRRVNKLEQSTIHIPKPKVPNRQQITYQHCKVCAPGDTPVRECYRVLFMNTLQYRDIIAEQQKAPFVAKNTALQRRGIIEQDNTRPQVALTVREQRQSKKPRVSALSSGVSRFHQSSSSGTNFTYK